MGERAAAQVEKNEKNYLFVDSYPCNDGEKNGANELKSNAQPVFFPSYPVLSLNPHGAAYRELPPKESVLPR